MTGVETFLQKNMHRDHGPPLTTPHPPPTHPHTHTQIHPGHKYDLSKFPLSEARLKVFPQGRFGAPPTLDPASNPHKSNTMVVVTTSFQRDPPVSVHHSREGEIC